MLPQNDFGRSLIADRANNDDLQIAIQRENLRQAIVSFDMYRLSFKISLLARFACTIAVLVGSGLLLTGKISEGALTTSTSVISGACFYQISKEARERAEKANKQLSKAWEELESED